MQTCLHHCSNYTVPLTLRRYQNPRDKDDCVTYKPLFMTRLTKHCRRLKESDIKVTVHDPPGVNGSKIPPTVPLGDGPGPAGSSTRPKREKWIKELQGYKEWITGLGGSTVRSDQPAPKVKVAILDDGARLADLNGVQYGWSFRADSQAYFVGPGKHGTEMAVCVRAACSVAELYIGRLDDSGLEEQNQAFTISSCFKALKWALDQGADVISMSWTYEMRSDKDDDMKNFEGLVKMAVDGHNAVLFGSLPDLGALKDASTRSPVGLDNVIKISSATEAGNVVDDNVHQHSDFLLPGDDIENSLGETVRGSSFATAYAAGLAALVLYSFRVLDASLPVDDNLARTALRVAKSPKGMKGIFGKLAPETGRDRAGGGSKSNIGRFIRPANILRAPADPSMNSVAHLRNIVNNLVPDELIREVFPTGVPED